MSARLTITAPFLAACAAWVFVAAGCAQKADWIGGTLVTVDVSGVWRGSLQLGVGTEIPLEMTLTQRGPKVTGEARLRGDRISIEGTVRGDVFAVSAATALLRAEATVAGDEMSGSGATGITMGATSAVPGNFTFKLWRQPGGQDAADPVSDPQMRRGAP